MGKPTKLHDVQKLAGRVAALRVCLVELQIPENQLWEICCEKSAVS
jgi:hypothetical protein